MVFDDKINANVIPTGAVRLESIKSKAAHCCIISHLASQIFDDIFSHPSVGLCLFVYDLAPNIYRPFVSLSGSIRWLSDIA